MSLLVHLNGWPGTGKLAIARRVAHKLKARLLDNHTMLNTAEALFDRMDPNWRSLRDEVRSVTLKYVRRLPPATVVVLTDVVIDGEADRRWFEDYYSIAREKPATIFSVVLDCELAENERRIQSPGRRENHKLTSLAVLRSMRADNKLLRPKASFSLFIDVTRYDADTVATIVVEAVQNRGVPE